MEMVVASKEQFSHRSRLGDGTVGIDVSDVEQTTISFCALDPTY